MFRHVFLTVLFVSVVAVVVGVLLSPSSDKRKSLGFPWEISLMPDGSTSVFQINLGKTRLGEVEKLFNETAELTLFKSTKHQSHAVIEAYFDKIQIGGLKAKIVLGFALNQQQVMAIYDRGVRISTLGSGTRRVTLSSEDSRGMRSAIINSITYMPSINLQPIFIQNRFGKPESTVMEKTTGSTHWLYPQKGVDVVLNEEAKDILQYVLPKDFSLLSDPLK